jgi:hypothetical protein
VSDLLEFATEAHGGREPWSHASAVTATVDIHGGFFEARGQGDLLGPCEVRAALDRQYSSVRSARSGHTILFDGKQDPSLSPPRAVRLSRTWSIPVSPCSRWPRSAPPLVGPQHRRDTARSDHGRVGRAELDDWNEVGESWRWLQVTFPESLFTHERTHIYYFDSRTGLQRRMDYTPEVTKGLGVAHHTRAVSAARRAPRRQRAC